MKRKSKRRLKKEKQKRAIYTTIKLDWGGVAWYKNGFFSHIEES